MVDIIKASKDHVKGIARVCTEGYWSTYSGLLPAEYIERIVKEFYNQQRILKEVTHTDRNWGGYFVALEDEEVIGAGGGGMIGDTSGEIFVLYMDPKRRNEGIGYRLLAAITEQQKNWGATEQWVSVQKGNQKGIPFYEAKGFSFQYEKPGYANKEGEDFVSLRYHRYI